MIKDTPLNQFNTDELDKIKTFFKTTFHSISSSIGKYKGDLKTFYLNGKNFKGALLFLKKLFADDKKILKELKKFAPKFFED